MSPDRYAEILGGKKKKMPSFDACVTAVRMLFPMAYAEGSTGYERTFWLVGNLVAHAWPTNTKTTKLGAMWLRVVDAEKGSRT